MKIQWAKGNIVAFSYHYASPKHSLLFFKFQDNKKQHKNTKCFSKSCAQQKQWRIPWFTNSGGLLEELPWGTTAWLVRLVEDILPCDWTALLSISCVLVVQKSSDVLGLSTGLPTIITPFDGASTVVTSTGLL